MSIPISLTLSEAASAMSVVAITRSDNGLSVAGVSFPITLTNSTGFVWTGSFTPTDATTPPTFSVGFTITFPDGSVSGTEYASIASGSLAAGRYTSETLMDETAGGFNLSIYSDLNASGTVDRVVLQRAIDKAEDELDDLMRGGQYVIPFAGTIPPAISRWATDMAIWQLYRTRGVRADDAAADKMKAAYDQARKEALIAKATNLIQLTATRNDRTPTGPYNVMV